MQGDWVYPAWTYSFTQYWHENEQRSDPVIENFIGLVGGRGGPVGQGKWGQVGPGTNDDTFYYRRPAYYAGNTQEVPTGLLQGVLPSEWRVGLNHGDTVSADGTYYMYMNKKGDQSTKDKEHRVSMGMKWE